MRRILIFSVLFWIFGTISLFSQSSVSAYASVDPFIGTAGEGNTFPAATVPFGMMQWGPDTRPDGWYHYGDKTIRGLSLTHISGAGCVIYADVPVLPWPEQIQSNSKPYELTAAFSHDHEEAHPGYYSVQFDNGIKAELTVSKRAGIGEFHFPSDAPRTLIFKAAASATHDADHRATDISTVEIRGNQTVVGSVHSGGFCGSPTHYVLYFVARFAKPFATFGTWTDEVNEENRTASGHFAGAYVSFASSTEPVVMKIGISFVSVENAEENLAKEIPGWNFDTVRAAARVAWTKRLDKVQVQGGTPEQQTTFYTGLYHMLLSPNIFSDENGDYIGFDQKVHRLPPGQMQFANFSDWDIYRNVMPLQSLLFPEQTSQIAASLVRDAEQSGWLPRWPVANDVTYVMGGDSPAILLSEAYAFGARSFDLKSALHFMVKAATIPGKGLHNYAERPDLEDYLKKGYVPLTDDNEAAASITLEYANADFAVSQFAEALGDRADSTRLMRSAQNWRNLFDPESKWIRPKTEDGNFITGWDPDHLLPHHVKTWDKNEQMGFEEGNTWQYTFMLPFSYAGLFKAMGGNERAVSRLDQFFEKLSGWGLPNFTVANEPDFCAPYAYLWAGAPWKTQQVIDRIRKETFAPKPDGLPGNDDLGATSGVYVWNALGIYPEIPGVGGLAVGTPMFSRAEIHLGNGKMVEFLSKGSGIYVHSLNVNGSAHASSWLRLSELSKPSNRIEFELQSDPDHNWAIQPKDFPPSFDSK